MLGKLFGSNARVKILKAFLFHPEKKYYIRQLARNLKLQVNSVRRELENLEKFGLLIPSERAGEDGQGDSHNHGAEENESDHGNQEKKYYQVNTDFTLFGEIKDLIVKAQILHKDDFINKLKRAGKIKLLILTGVFVNNQNSPVDILIVGRIDRPKLLRLIRELQKELGREINFTVMDQREFRYRREMTDVFLYNVLEGKKIVAVDEMGVS